MLFRSLLALIGTICFARVFAMFLANFNFNVDKMLLGFFNKRVVIVISFAVVIIGSGLLFKYQAKGDLVNKELYPVEAVKYIKKNLNVDEIRLFNDYNFGSYLVFNDTATTEIYTTLDTLSLPSSSDLQKDFWHRVCRDRPAGHFKFDRRAVSGSRYSRHPQSLF